MGRGAFVAVVALVLAQCWRFRAFVTDDAYISFRYSRRLAQGLGLTWTDGEAVEGYTDLLWVLLVAVLDPLGSDGMGSARLLGVTGAIAALWAVSVDPLATTRPTPARALSGGALLASSASLAAWAVGGLEHTFLAGLVGLGIVALVRAGLDAGRGAWLAAGLFGAAVLTRADGVVLWVGALVGLVLTTPARCWRPLWPAAVVPLAAVAGQQLFRVVYYGDWVPNTARVKVSFTWVRASVGVEWMTDALLAHPGLVFGALATLILVRERTPRLGVPALVVITWTVYGAYVGGDIFAAWRMFVPALPALAMLVAEGASRGLGWPWVLPMVPLVPLHAWLANSGPAIEATSDDPWIWYGRDVGRVLKRAWGARRPLLAVDAAGAVPYWSELPSLDLLGLTDTWLPLHPPKNFGKSVIGHDLGNGDYVWSRAPDLLLFNSSLGSAEPRFVSGRELLRRVDFDEVYQLVYLRVRRGNEGHLRGVVYVRREDGPLAVVRTDDRIVVPSWFLANRVEVAARPDAEGELRAWIQPGVPGVVPSLRVPAGSWTVSGDGSSVELRCGGVSATPLGGDPGARVLRLDEPTQVDVVAWPATSKSAWAGEVRIERTTAAPTHVCAPVPTVPLAQVQAPLPPKATLDSPGTVHFGASGVRVLFPERAHPTKVELWLEAGRSYVVRWLRDGEWVTSSVVQRVEGAGLVAHPVEPPLDVVTGGVDGFELEPRGPSGVLGQVRASFR